MKVKVNKHIIFSILLIVILAITVLFLSLVQGNGFNTAEEIDMQNIPISADRIIYIRIGETKTFEDVFWIYSNRWAKEGLNWEVYDISFDPGVIVSYSPNSGILYPGDPPASISLTVTLTGDDIDMNTSEYTGWIGVRNANDHYDKSIVDITIVVVNTGG